MQLHGVDANLVVPLRALLEHRHVTRAARSVGLSQSSMSHALARLRAHFGDPLLVAAGRELVLSERARELREHVEQAVAQLERVFAPPAAFDARSAQRSFRIAATDNLELYVLPGLLASLRKQAPGIDLRVRALPEDWAQALARGEIDLKLGRKSKISGALAQQQLSEERFTCVVRRGHPVRDKPTLREWAALDHVLVTPRPGADATSVVDALLAEHGLARRIVLAVPHFMVAPHVVASTDLVLTAPERLLAPFLRSLKLRAIQPPLRLPRYALSQVWAVRAHDDEAHRWLRSAVADVMQST